MNAGTNAGAVRLWVPGDWNGFFGLFTNVLLNVIVLTGLCLGVVQLPADTVFGRILPALGIALPLGNLFYAYLAWKLAKAEGRSDVTAMPYGPSVPHMFIVVFLVMLPVYLETKDAQSRLAGRPGLVLHHRRHRAARRLHRAAIARADAARRDARHAGRHLGGLHLDAPGVPALGDAVDRPGVLCDRADRLDRQRAVAGRPAGRPGRGDRRCGDRLDRVVRRLERLHAGRRGEQIVRAVRLAPAGVLRPMSGPAWPRWRRCWPRRSRWASTTSPRR